MRMIAICIVMLAACDATESPSGRYASAPTPSPGNGGREIALAQAQLHLLVARGQKPDAEIDRLIVELLGIQCQHVQLPAGLVLEASTIDKVFPLERLPEARFAWCGSLTLASRETVSGIAFQGKDIGPR